MIVINLWGAPGSGKSTLAAELFSIMKKRSLNVELVTEFAKDMTWENNMTAIGCQEYIFGNQSWRLERLRDKVDFIITDSPLPLSILYNNEKRINKNDFSNVVMDVFNSFKNVNYVMTRKYDYIENGRNETEEEANDIQKNMMNLLLEKNIDHTLITNNSPQRILFWLEKDGYIK